MALRENGARYKYGLSRLRVRALNDDLTHPTKSNMVGGAGDFDFSDAAAPAAVTFSLKVDGNTTITGTIDLDDVGIDINAVTAEEWQTAMAAGLTAASATNFTASVDGTTGRVKLAYSGSGDYVQFWGEAAKYAMFGQGKGLKAVLSDTAQTLSLTPTVKEDTTQTTTDANLKDTEVIIEGYKKGITATLVDTAEDFEMMELIESGTLSADGNTYTDPDSSTSKVVVEIEYYNPIYGHSTNQEDAIAAWEYTILRRVKGSIGEETAQAGFGTKSYALVGTNYKDAAGVESGAVQRLKLALTAWSPATFDAMAA